MSRDPLVEKMERFAMAALDTELVVPTLFLRLVADNDSGRMQQLWENIDRTRSVWVDIPTVLVPILHPKHFPIDFK